MLSVLRRAQILGAVLGRGTRGICPVVRFPPGNKGRAQLPDPSDTKFDSPYSGFTQRSFTAPISALKYLKMPVLRSLNAPISPFAYKSCVSSPWMIEIVNLDIPRKKFDNKLTPCHIPA
ncbi:hypothetical protein BJ170DRAFT_596041 [Xylariales sp. AK1849]|nr:hypothetical protein BJ170DRAFT_596041 [Xylariales sp. AK1849]